jgi:hypothetical protein
LDDVPCEELSLDEGTRGGRLGHETPRGMENRLQIDSLTDDEDEALEPCSTKEVDGDHNASSDDVVEGFSLDPDFDYDNVSNLTPKV